MKEQSPNLKQYKPSGIHKFFDWIERLPGPYWLFYFIVIVLAGLLNLVVAWYEKVLPAYRINWYYALTAVFLGFFLFEMDCLFRITADSLTEFLPILDVSEEEKDRIAFEYTHLPAKSTAIIFWVGTIAGLAIDWFIFSTAIEMNQAFPELEVPIFALSWGVGFITIYMIIRAFAQTKKIYEGLRKINIYDLLPLYAISRFSAWLFVFIILFEYLLFLLNPSMIEATLSIHIFIMVMLVFVSSSALWIPLRRVNRILILEKRKLLNNVTRRIELTFNTLHAMIDQQETSRINETRETLQSLMIEKEFIESLRTWPWKPGTFTGLLSLMVLPILIEIIEIIISRFINQ